MILETIAVIQTANAAIGAVKELVGNGKDLMDCGKELGEYFGAKSEIQKKADRNGSGNALEMFFELEKLKQQEEQLKEMMIYQGRPGMWTDWLNFQAQQKEQEKMPKRKQGVRQWLSEKPSRMDWLLALLCLLVSLPSVVQVLCFIGSYL